MGAKNQLSFIWWMLFHPTPRCWRSCAMWKAAQNLTHQFNKNVKRRISPTTSSGFKRAPKSLDHWQDFSNVPVALFRTSHQTGQITTLTLKEQLTWMLFLGKLCESLSNFICRPLFTSQLLLFAISRGNLESPSQYAQIGHKGEAGGVT